MIELMTAVYDLAASDGVVYAARSAGLSRSRDGGSTWEDAFASLEQPEPLATIAVASAGQTVFAGVKGAVLRSDNAGDHWSMVGLGSPPPLVVALALSPSFAEDGLIAAGTAEDGVFISSDRGETWVAWNFGLLDQNIYTLAFSPEFTRDRTLYVGTESGVFRSVSAGRGWRETTFPMDAAPVLSLAVFNGALVAGTEQHGLFASDDGGDHWRPILGVETGAVNALHAADSGLWILGENRLNHLSSLESAPVVHTLPKPAAALVSSPLGADRMILGSVDGEIIVLPL